jgi:hypothetical protein
VEKIAACILFIVETTLYLSEKGYLSRMEAAGWPTDLVTIGKIKKNMRIYCLHIEEKQE